jgi:hypothetical protein
VDVMSEAKKPLPVNRKRIAARVDGRKAAGDLLELLSDADKDNHDFMQSLVDTISTVCDLNPKPEATSAPEPIARLGSTTIPFGQHIGKDFDSVPLDYLDWLCREQEGFYKTLRAYLKHPELESRRRGL